MGLFDKLKKDLFNVAKKAVAEALEDKLNDVVTTGLQSSTASTAPASRTAAPAVADMDARFTQILASAFPDYSVRRSVRFDNGLPDAVPVDYLVCNEAGPVLAVIVCDKHLYGRKRLTVTVDACQAQGIPTQCYYTQFRNDRDYVIDRLGQVLK